MEHSCQIRVYYEDTDAGGIVYYANYMKFTERARSDCLRELGFGNKALMNKEEVMFVVHRVEADYLAPARLEDILTVTTTITEVGNASFTMDQRVSCGERPLCNMLVRLACVNLEGRPVRLPGSLGKTLESFMEQK